MLERLVVQQHSEQSPLIDLGLLAEQLLYYGEVHLMGGAGQVRLLLEKLGADQLRALLDLGMLKVHYMEDMFLIRCQDDRYSPQTARLYTKEKEPAQDPLRVVEETILATEKRPRKRLAQAIVARFVINQAIRDVDETRSDFLSAGWMKTGAEVLLREVLPSSHAPVEFEPYAVGLEDFRVRTNVDFSRIDRATSLGSPDAVLMRLATFRRALMATAEHQGELFATATDAKLLQARTSELLTAANSSKEKIEAFQSHALGSARAVREAINNHTLSFVTFLKCLERAKDFKAFIAAKDPDAQLLTEYLAAVSNIDPFDKLPGKVTKFLLFAGAGVVTGLVADGGTGLAVGAGLNFVDTFLFDRLVKRWTPGAFVSELAHLVRPP